MTSETSQPDVADRLVAREYAFMGPDLAAGWGLPELAFAFPPDERPGIDDVAFTGDRQEPLQTGGEQKVIVCERE